VPAMSAPDPFNVPDPAQGPLSPEYTNMLKRDLQDRLTKSQSRQIKGFTYILHPPRDSPHAALQASNT